MVNSSHSSLQKISSFLSLAIPICTALWFTLLCYAGYLSPNNTEQLPQHIRILHLISLIFRQDHFYFPLSLTRLIAPPYGIPLSLTDTIPLGALIFKIFEMNDMQYFGIWIILSVLLTTFFAYRICREICSDLLSTTLTTLLFISMPFFWYHSFFHPWLAGQWTILWGLSLFFQKRSYLSIEWYGIIVISAFIHPYFVFINFFIMIADTVRLYLYEHQISVMQAANFFAYSLGICIGSLSIIGMFYLPSFSVPKLPIAPLQLSLFIMPNIVNITQKYNISYIYPGLGIIIGLLVFLIIFSIYPKINHIKKYKPIFFSVFIFFLCSIAGGISFYDKTFKIYHNAWIENRILLLLTSGPRFIFPLLWMIPIMIAHTAEFLYLRKKFLCIIYLFCLLSIQFFTAKLSFNYEHSVYVPLSQEIEQFLNETSHIIWIGTESLEDIPQFEPIASYALHHKKTINLAPVLRYPSYYLESLEKETMQFLSQSFMDNTTYIIPQNLTIPFNLSQFGKLIPFEDVIFFKPDN